MQQVNIKKKRAYKGRRKEEAGHNLGTGFASMKYKTSPVSSGRNEGNVIGAKKVTTDGK